MGITADNASPNDVMIDKLMDMLPNFLEQANHSRCFLHIINLIAKMLLRQFDVPKKDAESVLDDAERELLKLAAGINMEEMVTVAEAGAGDKDDEENDDVEGWMKWHCYPKRREWHCVKMLDQSIWSS